MQIDRVQHHFEALCYGASHGYFSNIQTAARTACWQSFEKRTSDAAVRDLKTSKHYDLVECRSIVSMANKDLETAEARERMSFQMAAGA